MENKIPLYHNVGYNACRKLTCYYIGQEFTKNTMIRACDFELLICGNCGNYMELVLDCEYNYDK